MRTINNPDRILNAILPNILGTNMVQANDPIINDRVDSNTNQLFALFSVVYSFVANISCFPSNTLKYTTENLSI